MNLGCYLLGKVGVFILLFLSIEAMSGDRHFPSSGGFLYSLQVRGYIVVGVAGLDRGEWHATVKFLS